MDLEVVILTEEIEKQLNGLSMVYRRSKGEIIKKGILTNIALETMPNYKNYKSIISGISQARMIKGVKGRNAVESQILNLFSTYELEDINDDIIEKAIELMIITFDSVYSRSGERIKKQYRNALESIDFLYINLKLAVKIIAESLRNNDITLSNKTLHYITEAIKKEKSNIAKEYVEAYISGDEKQLSQARNNYRISMERMMNNYISSLKIPFETANEIGEEMKIVENLGKDFLDYITSYLLLEVRERIKENHQMQLMLEF